MLGKGSFGKVLLVEKSDIGATYAMKVLKKSKLKRQKQVRVLRGCAVARARVLCVTNCMYMYAHTFTRVGRKRTTPHLVVFVSRAPPTTSTVDILSLR